MAYCHTGAILYFVVYTNKSMGTEIGKEYGNYVSIVRNLMKPHLDKGHDLYVLNWYTTLLLFYWSSVKLGLLALLKVNMIQSFWEDEGSGSLLGKHWPYLSFKMTCTWREMKFIDYNAHMEAIDRKDMQLTI